MTSVFGHCHDSFWTVQFGGFCEFGSGSSGAQGSELEHTVHVLEFQFWIWSSWLNK